MNPSPPPGALVLGADYRALGVARSLGRRGVPVWLLAEKGEPLARVSRYARRSVPWPPGGHADRVAFLGRLAEAHGLSGWALIPSSDTAAALVARGHAELSRHYTHTTPAWEALRWVYDKRLTYALADEVGVPTPRTVRLGAVLPDTIDGIEFPAVLKPAIKEQPNALTVAKAWRIEDRHALSAAHAEASELMDPELLMIQELVPGGGESQFSYAALCVRGQPVAALSARRTRQYPADFGRASTFVETVECPEIVEPSTRLLGRLGWTGLIELEYKRDHRDGQLKLLDINPRVWGWHSLCGRAGIDFPWLLWRLLCDEDVSPARAVPGVGWLRLSTDTPTAVRALVGRRLALTEYWRTLSRPRQAAIFAWDDPLPGLAELPILLFVLSRRLLSGEAV